MQLVTRANTIRTSTRKVRIVADMIRGLSIDEALDVLSVVQRRGAHDLDKVLRSAIANAVNNSKLDRSNLKIKTIDVNEGAFLKRYRPSTRGRIHPYKKRASNIRIVLEEKVTQPKVVKTEVKKQEKVEEKVEKKDVNKITKEKEGKK